MKSNTEISSNPKTAIQEFLFYLDVPLSKNHNRIENGNVVIPRVCIDDGRKDNSSFSLRASEEIIAHLYLFLNLFKKIISSFHWWQPQEHANDALLRS